MHGTYGQTADYYLDATCSNPTLSISPASPTVCPGGTTHAYRDSAGTTTPTYTWTPGTGLSATGASVTAAPTTATTYTVTGYGPGVCIDTVSITVTVHTAFTTTITASGPATFCPGGSVTFTTADSPGYSYQWIKGTTDIPGATTTSYSATTAGNYYVYVTAPSGCNDTSNHLTVSYDPVPSPVISASGATTFCTPGSVTLTETSGTGSISVVYHFRPGGRRYCRIIYRHYDRQGQRRGDQQLRVL